MILRRVALAMSLCVGCFSEPAIGGDTDTDSGPASTSVGSNTTTGPTTTSATGTTATSTTAGTTSMVDTGDTDATTATSIDDTSGSGGECPPEAVPAPMIPAGWTGPHVLRPGSDQRDPPPCSDPLLASQPGVVVAGGHASCTCSCDPSCNVVWALGGGNGCDDAMVFELGEAADEECIAFSGPGWISNPGTYSVGSCAPAPSPELASLTWDFRWRVCDAPPEAPCVPLVPDGLGPCVRNTGVHDCMDPMLPTRIVTSVDGTILCNACAACDAESDTACASAGVQVFAPASCGGVVEQSIDPGSCSLTDEYQEAQVSVPPPLCPASDGAVTPVGAATFCCPP